MATDLCTVEGCDRVRTARGMCNAHYQRYRKYGDTFPSMPVASYVPRTSSKKRAKRKPDASSALLRRVNDLEERVRLLEARLAIEALT